METFLQIIKPEFFDIFGIFVFLFIIIISIQGLKNENLLAKWILITLLAIGVLGLIVDGTVVFTTYLR